ncbi:hypothetical protein NLI96_g7990 [Meripilus lineatus]|uniref:F-box domain-containing protein n=1 Tax=Meripilus lineatus TaxID=2056292 RepID=A0AAD5UZR5_9APHY|nr:hypothetical protein NLI96_g7990 [Physisporinus lineatus]
MGRKRRHRHRRNRIPRLPTEICEEIISYLDGQETLWACALVCRSWLPRSRVQLYRSAKVGRKRIHKFLDMIVMHPHLGVNLEQLCLGDDEDSTDIYRFFSDVIPLLPKITSLRYEWVPIPYLHLPLFSSGLLSLTSLTLWCIEADSFGDFVRFVSFHKHLKELTIWGCSWKRSSVHHYSFGVRWGRDLQNLSLVSCDYQRVFDILHWLGRSNSPCSIQCLEISSLNLPGKIVVPFIADHLAIQWATTMKAIRLDFSSDAKEAVFSSLTAYIRFCPNLHTVKLDIPEDTLWVLRQLPGVLSGLVSLRSIVFRLLMIEAEGILLGDSERAWTALDRDLGDGARFRSLEYVEVSCSRWKEVPSWWENDTGGSEDGESDSGRELNGEEGGIESPRAEKGKQRKGIPWGAELTSRGLASLHRTMNHVADFHRRQKPLTDIFPRLSERDILWCSIDNAFYALHITASNLVGMKSRNWRPCYCECMFHKPLDYS